MIGVGEKSNKWIDKTKKKTVWLPSPNVYAMESFPVSARTENKPDYLYEGKGI